MLSTYKIFMKSQSNIYSIHHSQDIFKFFSSNIQLMKIQMQRKFGLIVNL